MLPDPKKDYSITYDKITYLDFVREFCNSSDTNLCTTNDSQIKETVDLSFLTLL